MSRATYRAAHVQLLAVYDAVLGPYRGECGLCGGPDARHRSADAVAGGLLGGDPLWQVCEDYAPDPSGPFVRDDFAVLALLTVACDPRLHRVTQRVALEIEREVRAGM